MHSPRCEGSVNLTYLTVPFASASHALTSSCSAVAVSPAVIGYVVQPWILTWRLSIRGIQALPRAQEAAVSPEPAVPDPFEVATQVTEQVAVQVHVPTEWRS
jgi:hypothetical protein